MKITKLEIEMTVDEKRVWDKILVERSCFRISCGDCPFDDASGCSKHVVTNNVSCVSVKVIQPPLVLTEGMDCRGLQLRSGNQVLGVFKCTNKLLMVVYRTLGDLTDFVHSLPNGRNNDMVSHGNSTYDVIRKEA